MHKKSDQLMDWLYVFGKIVVVFIYLMYHT